MCVTLQRRTPALPHTATTGIRLAHLTTSIMAEYKPQPTLRGDELRALVGR